MNTGHFRCACGALNRVAEGAQGVPTCGRCKKELDLSGAPQDVSGEELLRLAAASPVPVVADFWAEWCGPCRVASPILDAVARDRAGDLIAVKVNSDENREVAARMGIQSIPTFVLYIRGNEIARQVGMIPRYDLDKWIEGWEAASPMHERPSEFSH